MKDFTTKSLALLVGRNSVQKLESSSLTIAMEAWKPASMKAMPQQSNTP